MHKYILESKIFSEFHWLHYHFQTLAVGFELPLAHDFINAVLCVENKIPGFAKKMTDRLASISGKDWFEPHYEQIVQLLAELTIFWRLAITFSDEKYIFQWEPVAGTSLKNPEIVILSEKWIAAIEIKSPSILNHTRNASNNDIQIGARIGDPNIFDELSKSGHATRPLDNKVKDFLVSAEEKFKPFKESNKEIFTILILCWTKHIFEATSPLLNEMSGLLTPQSFYKNNDAPVMFNSIDGIIVTDHLNNIIPSTREEGYAPGYFSPLHYGAPIDNFYVNPVYIHNNSDPKKKPTELLNALLADEISDISDPRVMPLDMVMWMGHTKRSTEE